MLTKLVICAKWGTKYGTEYVNRLYGMVARNITPPFQFICFTDSTEGIRPEVKCLPMPELRSGPPARTRGQWRKVTLWKEELYGLSGPALFIDLDSVIVDNLDPYFTYGDPDDVILARNWARPLQRLGQTSVFRFPIGRNGHVLRNFEANPQGVADQFRYEQHFVTHSIGSRLKFWPPSWTRHFRLHCLGSLPMRYLRQARLPRNARIVTFAGGPNPSDVVDGRWSPYSPPYGGVWTHLRRTFDRSARRGTWWRHLKQFVRPCGWIRELWRD